MDALTPQLVGDSHALLVRAEPKRAIGDASGQQCWRRLIEFLDSELPRCTCECKNVQLSDRPEDAGRAATWKCSC